VQVRHFTCRKWRVVKLRSKVFRKSVKEVEKEELRSEESNKYENSLIRRIMKGQITQQDIGKFLLLLFFAYVFYQLYLIGQGLVGIVLLVVAVYLLKEYQ